VLTLLEYSYIHKSCFEEWSMAYLRMGEMTRRILLKYSTHAVFDPFGMTAQQALGFIQEMAGEYRRFLESEAREIKRAGRHTS
jgi:hypothetical protein